jgi:hypothetical protein
MNNNDCYIVNNGKRHRVGPPKYGTGGYKLDLKLDAKTKTKLYIAYGQKRVAARLFDDFALIQEHFGNISRSAAARIAIALTANAIRKNKALPNVNDFDAV